MADLYLSICLMMMLCGIALAAGARVAGTSSKHRLLACEMAVGSLMLVYMLFLWDRPVLSRLLPFSSVIILGNWLPVPACFFVGVCIQTTTIHWCRRAGLTMITCGLCVYSLVRPTLGDPPRCFNLQPGLSIQHQTTDATCSAASAANLLRLYGIETSEHEMARLCLTRKGTHWQGVYRGLKLKLHNTPWDVVAEEFEIPSATQMPVRDSPPITYMQMPAVLSLSFKNRGGSQSLATGFGEGTGHSVLLLEVASDGAITVFDPSPEYGFEYWPQPRTFGISRAVAFRIVPREPGDQATADLEEQIRTGYKLGQFSFRWVPNSVHQ